MKLALFQKIWDVITKKKQSTELFLFKVMLAPNVKGREGRAQALRSFQTWG